MYRLTDLISSDELYHHGIKGQKWGVRRFQKKDGSLTPAGRKRYDDGGSSQKKQKEYKVPKNKSLHRLKIEEKYKAQGMSEKEAEQAASKRIRGEQFAVGAAAVTVAACVAYNKYKNYNADKVLKNVEFHRILETNNPDASVREGARYVSYKNNDKMKYRGLYGNELKKKIEGEKGALKIESDMARIRGESFNPDSYKALKDKKIYDMTIKSKNDIKVASEKRARETFEKLYNTDSEFRKNFEARVKFNRFELAMKKGMTGTGLVDNIADGKDLSPKDLKSKAYDIFNIMLVDGNEKSRSNQKKFYDALKEQGMNAVQDMNDKKYSGYKTKNPLILFDGEFEYSKEVLSDSRIAKDLKKSMTQILGGPAVATAAAYAAAFGASPVMEQRSLEKQAILYMRKHPNSNMSKKEVEKMLAKKQKK